MHEIVKYFILTEIHYRNLVYQSDEIRPIDTPPAAAPGDYDR